MATTPPTAADIDAWFAENALGAIVNNIVQNLGGSASFWVLAYTQDNGTQVFLGSADPTQDDGAATLAFGLVAQYGAITVRGYTYEFTAPSPAVADVTMGSTELAALNDSANWVTQ